LGPSQYEGARSLPTLISWGVEVGALVGIQHSKYAAADPKGGCD